MPSQFMRGAELHEVTRLVEVLNDLEYISFDGGSFTVIDSNAEKLGDVVYKSDLINQKRGYGGAWVFEYPEPR